MTDMPSPAPLPEKLDNLHDRVEAMLDTPVPKEGDAWPLPIDAAIKDVGAGYEPQMDKPAPV